MSDVKATVPGQGGIIVPAPANTLATPPPTSAPAVPKTNASGTPSTPQLTKVVPKSSTTAPVPGTGPGAKPASTAIKQAPKASVSSSATTKTLAKTPASTNIPGSKPPTATASSGAPSTVKLTATAAGPAPKTAGTTPGIKPTAIVGIKPVLKPAGASGAKSVIPGTTPAANPVQAGPTKAKALPPKVAGPAAKSPPTLAKGPAAGTVKTVAPGPASTKSVPASSTVVPVSVPTTTPGYVEKTDKFLADGTKIVAGVSTFLTALDGLLGDDKKADVKPAAPPAAKAVPAKPVPAPTSKAATPVTGTAKVVVDPKTAAKPKATPKPVVKDVHANPPQGPQHGQITPHAHPHAQTHSQLPCHTQGTRGLEHTIPSQPYIPVSHPYSQQRGVGSDEYEQHNVPTSANILVVGDEALPAVQSTGYWMEHDAAPQQHLTEIVDEDVTYVQYTQIQDAERDLEYIQDGEYVDQEEGVVSGQLEIEGDDIVVGDTEFTTAEIGDWGGEGAVEADEHFLPDEAQDTEVYETETIVVTEDEGYADDGEGEQILDHVEEPLWSGEADVDAGDGGQNDAANTEHDEHEDGNDVYGDEDAGLTIVHVDVDVDVDLAVDYDQAEGDDPTTHYDDGEGQDEVDENQYIGDPDDEEGTQDNYHDNPDADESDDLTYLAHEEDDTPNHEAIADDDENGDGDDGYGQAMTAGADSDEENNTQDDGVDGDGEGGDGDDDGYQTPQADDGEDSD